jgi:hypothetical protein
LDDVATSIRQALHDGAYIFKAPTTLPNGCMRPGTNITSVMSFMATVRSAYPGEVGGSSRTSN